MTVLSRLARLLVLALLSATVVSVSVAASPPASACSCAAVGLRESLDTADGVFTATVLEDVEDGGTGLVDFAVDVDAVYVGAALDFTTIETSAQSSACGITGLEEGRRYLFFGAGGPETYRTSICDFTTEAEPALLDRVERIVGSPTEPTPGGSPSEDRSWLTWTLLGVPVAALLGVGAWLAVRRRAT